MPRDLETIVLKAIAREPDRRYQTAAELAEDLNRFLEDRPIRARPLSQLGNILRWCRRKPAVAFLLVSLFIALCAGGSGVAWKWWEASVQRDEANQHRLRAESHYEKAFAMVDQMLMRIGYRQLVDRMLMRVGDKQVAEFPLMDTQRQLLLEDALSFYRGFLQEGSTDPEVRRESARAYEKTGKIYLFLGKMEQAEGAFRNALALRRVLTNEFPQRHVFRHDLAVTHRDLADVLAISGRLPEAEGAYQTALAMQEQLEREYSGIIEYKSELVATYRGLAEVYRSNSRHREGLKVLEKALPIAEMLSRGNAHNVSYQDSLAHAFFTRGNIYRSLGESKQSLGDLDAAREIWDRLVREHPNIAEYQERLAGAHNNMGMMYRSDGQIAEAKKAYESSLSLMNRIVLDYPEDADYQSRLAKIHNNLGFFYNRLGEKAVAAQHYDEAMRRHGDLAGRYPKRVEYTVNYASSCANWANDLRDNDRAEESLPVFEQVIKTLVAVREQDPGNLDAREFSYVAHFGRALAFLKLDRPQDSVPDWRRVVELSEGQQQDSYRIYRPRALYYVGEPTRSVAEVEAILSSGEKRGWVLEELARACTLSSEAIRKNVSLLPDERDAVANEYAARAVALLAEAARAGQYPTSDKVEKLKKNSLFDPLHARADFQEFRRALEADADKSSAASK